MTNLYAATKVFNLKLGQGMLAEWKDKIDVLNVNPWSVKTAMNTGDAFLFSITAKDHVSGSLDKLGHENESFGHYWHCLQRTLLGVWPAG